MRKYKNHTLQEYLSCLSAHAPVPGGGSAAALAGAIGVSLISMAARYSQKGDKKKPANVKIKRIIENSEKIRKRLIDLVDLDSQAYLGVVKARNAPKEVRKKASKKARAVPAEVCHLCYKAVQLTPFLVQKGNPNLVSDVEVAVELLLAAFNSAMINVEINK